MTQQQINSNTREILFTVKVWLFYVIVHRNSGLRIEKCERRSYYADKKSVSAGSCPEFGGNCREQLFWAKLFYTWKYGTFIDRTESHLHFSTCISICEGDREWGGEALIVYKREKKEAAAAAKTSTLWQSTINHVWLLVVVQWERHERCETWFQDEHGCGFCV